MNSKKISLKNDLWRTHNFFHHSGYARGAKYTPAWEFHKNDPTKVNLGSSLSIKQSNYYLIEDN